MIIIFRLVTVSNHDELEFIIITWTAIVWLMVRGPYLFNRSSHVSPKVPNTQYEEQTYTQKKFTVHNMLNEKENKKKNV